MLLLSRLGLGKPLCAVFKNSAFISRIRTWMLLLPTGWETDGFLMWITSDEIQLNFLGLQYFNNTSLCKRGSMEKAGALLVQFFFPLVNSLSSTLSCHVIMQCLKYKGHERTPIKKEHYVNSYVLKKHNLHQWWAHRTDFEQPRMHSVNYLPLFASFSLKNSFVFYTCWRGEEG